MSKIKELRKALDLMRRGGRLMQMHTPKSVAWFIVPGGEIKDEIAAALRERNDVQPNEDGLFPGHSQTYRLRQTPFLLK